MKTFYSFFTFFYVFWPLAVILTNAFAEPTTTTTVAPTQIATINKTNESMVTVQTPIAEKLVRYRRQPPVTIIKHVIRSSKRSKPRRRIKRPKLRYGPPPSYIFDDQYAYYKPKTQFIASIPTETPAFNFDEFQHLNLEADDFELPPSSYEAHSMDLDFYNHHNNNDEENTYHHDQKIKLPTLSTDNYGGSNIELNHNVQTTYEYKSKQTRKPHQKYGVPKDLSYSTDFNSNPSDFHTNDFSNLNSYQSQSEYPYGSSIGSLYEETPEINSPHKPATQYGIHSTSDQHSSLQTYNVPDNPKVQYDEPIGNTGTYPVYEKKIPNTGYDQSYIKSEHESPASNIDDYSNQNFGKYDYTEPESLLPQQHFPTKPQADDIEITYSPSYEINLVNSGNKYHNQPGSFAEPPPEQPTKTYHSPSPGPQPTAAEIPHQPGTIDDYIPPTHELPLNTQYKKPPFDYPKSSYEVPIYDPIPFDASTNNEHEYYPPNQFEQSQSSSSEVDSHNQENNFPTNFQYDQQQPNESEQKSIEDTTFIDAHASGSDTNVKSTTKLQRNRKRQPSPMKHILDVPELKKAFDDAKQRKQQNFLTRQTDSDVNASTFVKERLPFLPTQPFIKQENLHSTIWNPMRIKTSTRTETLNSTSKPINQQKQSKSKFRPQSHLTSTIPLMTPNQSTQQILELKKNSSTNIEIVSIEKSRSQSYYDGTIAPPVITMSNLFNTRLNKFRTPTQLPPPTSIKPASTDLSKKQTSIIKPYKDEAVIKRTTKSIFDTTYFQTPQNLKKNQTYYDFSQTLPKNHKLF